jgi:hypothetical protein
MRSFDVSAAADLTRRWQGDWVVRDADYEGSVQAWAVHGNIVTVHDATQRWSAEESFTVRSPCGLVRTLPMEHGTRTTSNTFVFAGDTLHVALGSVAGGMLENTVVNACVGDRVYLYDPETNRCEQWNASMTGSWTMPDAECSVHQGPVTSTFVLRTYANADSERLAFYGDALLSPMLEAHVAEPRASFDDACERADSLAAQSLAPSP